MAISAHHEHQDISDPLHVAPLDFAISVFRFEGNLHWYQKSTGIALGYSLVSTPQYTPYA
jgi:hypothetical protein